MPGKLRGKLLRGRARGCGGGRGGLGEVRGGGGDQERGDGRPGHAGGELGEHCEGVSAQRCRKVNVGFFF